MSEEIIRIRGAQPTTTPLGLSVPRSRAVAQCYSTGERKLQYEKSINSWPFLCKEADRATTTRHSFGREPINYGDYGYNKSIKVSRIKYLIEHKD